MHVLQPQTCSCPVKRVVLRLIGQCAKDLVLVQEAGQHHGCDGCSTLACCRRGEPLCSALPCVNTSLQQTVVIELDNTAVIPVSAGSQALEP